MQRLQPSKKDLRLFAATEGIGPDPPGTQRRGTADDERAPHQQPTRKRVLLRKGG
jgi:hypothetical protein